MTASAAFVSSCFAWYCVQPQVATSSHSVERASSAGARVASQAPSLPAAPLADQECRLVAPDPGADVRGVVALRVQANQKVRRVTVALDGKELGSVSASESGVFAFAWKTNVADKEGKHSLEATCLDDAGRPLALSGARSVWLGNTLGAVLGTNGPLSAEHIESSAGALGVRWLRGGPEWSFHRSEVDFVRDQEARKHGVSWPALVSFRAQAAAAHARGLRVLVPAMGASKWARGEDRGDGGNPWHQAILPEKRLHFAEYVKQLCLEGADAVEVINEPNLRNEYAFGPSHPRFAHPEERVDDYVLLLRAVYRHVKADPVTAECQIGIGGTSPSGHEMIPDPTFVHPVLWYRRLFTATADDRATPISAAGHFDFAAVHPYADANTRDGPAEWGHRWLRFALQYGDAAYGHGMAMVTRVHQVLVEAGVGDRKLWATEVGLATFGGSCTGKPCASEALQAKWVQQYTRAWFSRDQTGWRAPLASHFYGGFTGPMIFYQWRDRSDGLLAPTDKEGFFGLQRHDGTPKPSFGALRAEASRRREQ